MKYTRGLGRVAEATLALPDSSRVLIPQSLGSFHGPFTRRLNVGSILEVTVGEAGFPQYGVRLR